MNRALLLAFLSAAALFGLTDLAYMSVRPGLYAAVVGSAGVSLFIMCLRPPWRNEMAGRGLLIASAMPLLAWSVPNIWLLYLIMCVWVPLMAGRFERIAPVYLFSLLLLPALDLTTSLGGLKLFDFGVLDALALGAATAIAINPRRSKVPPTCDGWAIAVLLVLGIALSRETSLSNFFRNGLNIVFDLWLPYYILSRGTRSLGELRAAMRWFACGGLALAAVLIYETWKAWPIYIELYGLHEVPMVLMVKARGGLMRAGGPFVEPTSAALVMAMCVTSLYLLRGEFQSRVHHFLLLAVAFAGLSAPQSRGAWIGLFIALITADIFCRRYQALTSKGAIAAALLAAAFTIAQFSPAMSESIGLTGGSSETSEYRRQLLDRGVEEFFKSPLIGYSMPQLNVRLADLRQGEGIIDFVNTYVWIGLIAGLAGLVAFLGTFFHFLRGVWRAGRSFSEAEGFQAAAFAAGCLVMLLEMLFFTSFGTRPAFLTFALFGFSAAVLVVQRSRNDAAAPVQAIPEVGALQVPS